jgi:hypothetical protein
MIMKFFRVTIGIIYLETARKASMSHIIKRFSYFKNLILTILVATVVSFPLAKAEPVAEIASIIDALNSLMSEGVNNTSLNLQPLFDGVATKSGNSANQLAPTPFIIGGTTTPRNLYREYTLVVITDRSGEIIGLCGGTMIASNKVLTAAHCSLESAGQYFIIPGFYAFSDQLRESDIFPVRRVAVHPDYNDFTSANDAAILTLTRNYFTKIAPVLSGTNKLAGNNAVVIGTGLTSTNPQNSPNALQEVLAPITSNSNCNNQWESFTGIRPIRSSMMCAGFTTDGRGSCGGDSGSPLFVQINGQRVVAGTVSFGFDQCELNRATQAYARMTSMTDFIRSESPNTIFIESNQISIAPIITFLLSEASGSGGSGASGGSGGGSVAEPATSNYPSLPARISSGTDLVIAVVGDENDTFIGQIPEVFHLNSPQNGAQMIFGDIGLDEVNIVLQRSAAFTNYQFWIRTPQATFPYADLAVGTYAPAAPISPFSDQTKPSIDFTDNGNPCLNEGDRSFTITQLSNIADPFASPQLITAVEGYFEISCADDGGKIRGRFRYNR